MAKKKAIDIKLRHLKVRNFKALDIFEIDFPAPRMKNDPDIFIMGSKNGLGKTSVLEACTLLFLAAEFGKKGSELRFFPGMPIDLPDLLIRAGAECCEITGKFQINDQIKEVSLTIRKTGEISVDGDIEPFHKLSLSSAFRPLEARGGAERFLRSLMGGLNLEPLLLPCLMYFHSYRKVQEGNPELSMMVESRSVYRRKLRPGFEFPVSTFKLEILQAMMEQANLFEGIKDEKSQDVLVKLNEFVEKYAGGKIEKLRPSQDNTIDFRISPTKGGDSYTFDGLSSGQKEIISTLFLIWHYSQRTPSIVLIDEPELHLNVQWHRDFVEQVWNLAPNNQYIIATHSEDLFSSVDNDHRVLLENS